MLSLIGAGIMICIAITFSCAFSKRKDEKKLAKYSLIGAVVLILTALFICFQGSC